MADEIKITLRATVTNGDFKHDLIPSESISEDQTTKGGGSLWLDVGTSAETVSFGDGTPGYVYLKNHDPTNYVQFGSDNTGIQVLGRLKAGQVALLPLDSGATLSLQANTAACKVQVRYANA